MSTILEALRERQEGQAVGTGRPLRETLPGPSAPRWTVVALGVVAVVGSATSVTFFLAGRDVARTEATPSVAALHTATPAPPRAVPTVGERPWGRVRKEPGRPPLTQSGPDAVQGASAAIKVPAPPRGPASPSRLEVEAIAYSPVGSQRAVRLSIDGGSAVTLHEGESTRGVEVQLILPDAIYVRRGMDVFALEPRR